MESKEMVVLSDAERALVQLDEEDLERAPSLGIQRVKTRQGKFVIDKHAVGDHLNLVILDHARLHTFYRGAFSEGSNQNPDCWATGSV
jgi:hypothetical protein